MEFATPKRVGFYIDGCNLYHGMRESKYRRYYWLDLVGLAGEFLKPDQCLVCTKYFTARVLGNPGKNERHSVYIDALKARGRIEVIEGRYQPEPFRCGRCHNERPVPKEKQTDTNIATHMVIDAFRDRWDVAFVMSGDADLVPPIQGVRGEFPKKFVFVVFPPSRGSDELRQATKAFYTNQSMFKRHQLPDVVTAGEVTLRRPDYWQ